MVPWAYKQSARTDDEVVVAMKDVTLKEWLVL
jgi:hypothetical protein